MPKSKITHSSTPAYLSSSAQRAPVKINADGTPLWYKILMFGIIIIGLLWLVVNYLAGPHIPVMVTLGPWNYAIGFGCVIVGLLMTMGWR